MATIRDVAREAKVSISTVSYALNGIDLVHPTTRQRILDAVEQTGYQPRQLRKLTKPGKPARTIAIVLPGGPGGPPLDYHYAGELIRGVSDAANDFGFLVTVLYKQAKSPQCDYTKVCHKKQVHGAIIVNPLTQDKHLAELFDEDFPVVYCGRSPNPERVSSISIDNQAGAYQATEHLALLGHRRIGLLLPGELHYQLSSERCAGFQRALEAYGLPFDPQLVVNGGLSSHGAREAVIATLGQPNPPTAVFAGNDTQAFGVIRAITERGGRVPEDLAVVGFDDIALAEHCTPSLTTVRVPHYDLGLLTGRMTVRRIIRPEAGPEHTILPVNLIVRESCGVQLAHLKRESGSELEGLMSK